MKSETQNDNLISSNLSGVQYFLCSHSVEEHFPDCEKSIAFKSGYDFDGDELYYILATTDFEKIKKYYQEVIEPFNEKSNISYIDFWLRECCSSLLDDAPNGCLAKCKKYGIFKAIENIYGLTNEKIIQRVSKKKLI